MKRLLAILIVLLLPLPAQAATATDSARQAWDWLALVDAGKYDDSWSAASAYFQSKVTKEQWFAMIAPVRNGVGPVTARGQAAVTLTDSLPNAPFAHYAVVVFPSAFAIKGKCSETVIMVLQDGEWKVAGYFIQ